jgi:hypothetical protein
MVPIHASTSTVSDRQELTPNAPGRAPPVQRRLRGVIGESYEDAGAYIHAALWEDIDSTGFSDDDLADRTGISGAQLSRIRTRQAHAPDKLVTWAIDNSRHRPPRYVVAVCTVAEGEFKPKPPPSVEDRHAATLEVLHDMGIEEVVRERVTKMLGRNR